MRRCFFCDIQKQPDDKRIYENKDFFSRYDDFPVNRGHCEVVSKHHITSFFILSPEQVQSLYDLVKRTKRIVQDRFSPDGFNIGINEGKMAGQTIDHLHIHIIPRYKGDVKDPFGGVRNIFPEKSNYVSKAKKCFQGDIT